MPDLTVRGVRFHVQTPGTGDDADAPVVVFVHGLVMDNLSSFYTTLALPIAGSGARTVLYDLRGHGRTELTPSGHGVADAVADLFAILDALGHHRVHLVAHSFGGVIALNAALARPDRVAGLVLIEAHGPGEGPGWSEGLLNTLARWSLILEYERFADQMLASGRRRAGRQMATADALVNRTTLLADVAAIGPVRPADLAAVRCPVLAVYGQHSDVAAAGRLLLHSVPDCTLHVMAGHGHTALREGTAEILEVVLPWLAHHAGTRVPAAVGGGAR
ncbi:alpha/beta fold hydrolase [Actinomadura napierensis]|uniref:Alpha/beta hydrolase n=1 Tax=Actinomadura napierensis TaxID=267854 RepID=A0ABP5K9Z0_9ACTN